MLSVTQLVCGRVQVQTQACLAPASKYQNLLPFCCSSPALTHSCIPDLKGMEFKVVPQQH